VPIYQATGELLRIALGESLLRVHWVAVSEAWRARRANIVHDSVACDSVDEGKKLQTVASQVSAGRDPACVCGLG
jgi:hypothetical protein